MGKKSDSTVQEKESVTRELSKGSRSDKITAQSKNTSQLVKRVQPKSNKLNDRQLRADSSASRADVISVKEAEENNCISLSHLVPS